MDNTALVALVSAAAAGIGVTLAKDTKVSEFRQAWIDALRADVADFISLATRAFEEKHGMMPHKQGDKLEDLASLTVRLTAVMYRIVLRLDLKHPAKKPDHARLMLALGQTQKLIDTKTATREEFHAAAEEVWMATAALLDTAWDRVKRGEFRYRCVLWGAVAVIVCCGVGYVWDFTHKDERLPVSHISIDSPVRVDLHPTPVQATPLPQSEKQGSGK